MVVRKRSQRLNGLFPLSYTGVVPVSPVNFITELRQPTTQDVKNFYRGDLWLDVGTNNPPTSNDLYVLVDKEQNVATWVNFGGGAGDLDTLTGDTGGPVSPLAQNIDVLGDANAGLTTVGNPGAHSITITTTSGNPFVQTLTGNTGGAIGPDPSGNIDITTAGTTVAVAGSGNAQEMDFSLSNILLGTNGATITTGSSNVSLGQLALSSLTSGDENTVIGREAGQDIEDGSGNTLIGVRAGINMSDSVDNVVVGRSALTNPGGLTASNNVAIGNLALAINEGDNNTVVGYLAGSSLGAGDDNILIGRSAGAFLTSNDSDNILIGNAGVTGDNDAIRIGTDGTHTSCFVQGIAGVTVSNQETVIIDTMTGQLGSTTSGGGGNANAFYAEQQNNTPGAVTTLTTPIYPGANTMGITDGPMVEIYDPDNVFNPGDGAAVPASFTAPADGIYQLNWSIYIVPNGSSDFTSSRLTLYFDNNGTFRRILITQLPSVGGGIIRNAMALNASCITFMSAGADMTFKFGAGASPITGTFGFVPGPPTQVLNWISGFRIS